LLPRIVAAGEPVQPQPRQPAVVPPEPHIDLSDNDWAEMRAERDRMVDDAD
jgi:hypothetical protein